MPSPLLTPDQVADRWLGKTGTYWTRKARAQQIGHVKIGASIRFTTAHIQAYIDAHTVTADTKAVPAAAPALAPVVELDPLTSVITRNRKAVAR
ncbi:MAG: helix-turn-helix domain-containing protein [Promicromonosporaceae bacterium]|nr:helix-turn-helix domain-containing protein [Promicromonosporaceae bacterium]